MMSKSRVIKINGSLKNRAILSVCCLFQLAAFHVEAVKITHFMVPQFANRHEQVNLECHFEMTEHSASERLYSVKWYRLDQGHWNEFYSYKPANSPPAKKYNISGIRIDMRHSNLRQVVLKRVSLATSGSYRCEVTSKKSQGYDVQCEEGRLIVLELPEESPVISGGLPSYQLNERLLLNCTSPKTYPPTQLSWQINGKELGSPPLNPPTPSPKNGLYRSHIELNVSLSQDLFQEGKIRIKCTSNVQEDVFHSESERDSHIIEQIRLPEALKRVRTEIFEVPIVNHSSRCRSREGAVALLLLLNVLLLTTWSKWASSAL